MIERFLAHKLLRMWADAESREVRHVDFPRVSPMFRDYQSGYRASTHADEYEVVAERVGRVLQEMHPALARTLKQFYFEGRDPKNVRKAFNLAMADFCKRYDSTPLDLGYNPALETAI
tara:strand:- start:1101 stop:1454 length:354 start_codon:yes stop_codon:yes gene_type:complete